MADETKGVALAILGIVALIAVVGLVLLWMQARTTGQYATGIYEGQWGREGYDNPRHNTESAQYTTYYRGDGASTGFGNEGTYSARSSRVATEGSEAAPSSAPAWATR